MALQLPTVVYGSSGSLVIDESLESFSAGGQADVFRVKKEVAKFPHTPTNEDWQKLHKLMSIGAYKKLERVATVPTDRLYESSALIRLNPTKGLKGFKMRFVENSIPLIDLLDTEDQRKHKLSLITLIEIFDELHAVLSETVHPAGFVVGDLHANNIFVNINAPAGQRITLIDVDGYGYCNEDASICYPVAALAEDALHPRLEIGSLTGKDLHRRHFERDWYLFAIHLTHALTGLSPYVAGKVRSDYRNNNRKKFGLTIMNLEVSLHWKLLPMFLRMGKATQQALRLWLEVDARGTFPRGIITEYLMQNIVVCPKCGFELIAFRKCPKCRNDLL